MNIEGEESDSEYSDEEFTDDDDDDEEDDSTSTSSSASRMSTSTSSSDDSYMSTQSLGSKLASRPLVKYFKFEQVKYAGLHKPSKRSGHRAVCNDESMWIWGGYCPVDRPTDNNAEPPFPLFKEVTALPSLWLVLT